MTAEEIAAIYEAAEDIGDPTLVLAVMLALRDPEARRDIEGLLAAPPSIRRSARTLLGQREAKVAANG